MAQEEVVLLRVQLDEGKTTDRMKQLAVELAKTRTEQKELTQAYNQGLLSEEAYGQKSVELSRQLRAQQQEQTALTKNLELWDKATKGVADSYQAQQAQLSLAQRQYQQLAGSAANSTDETKALAGIIDQLRGTLKTTDAGMGLFVRNVGNYSGAIEPLIAELKRLEVQQKNSEPNSQAYQEQGKRIVGFQQQINKVGAEAGLTYEQTQAKLQSYGDAIQPVVENLVKLEEQQAKVAEGSEEFNRIGFRIQAAKKDIEAAVPPTESFGQALLQAAGESDTLGGAVQRATGFQEKFTQAQNLCKLAMGNMTGAAGVLRVAMLALPIFAVIAALGVLYSFFTRTREGSEFVARKMAALSAVLDTLANLAADAGKALFDAANNPKQAFVDLVEFIGTNLFNRLKAFAVVAQGVLDLDLRKVADGFIQAGTGIENATSKAAGFTRTLQSAAGEAERLSQLQQQLDRDTDDNIDTNKRLLNEVERLKNVRDNEFNSLAVRRKANEDAFKVEMQRENTLASLAQRRVTILTQQIALEGGRDRVSRERYQELKDAENELADIREDAAGKQNELITNRYQLDKEGRDAANEAAEKAAEARRKELQVQLGLLEVELQKVQKNYEEELNILRRKLDTGRKLELAQKDVTVRQKQLIDAKYEADKLKLETDAERQRAASDLQAERDFVAGALAVAAEGAQQRYELERRALQLDTELQLAALDVREDNSAKEYAIRAKLQADLDKLAQDNAAREVERQRQALDERANLLALGADRQLLGLSQEETRRVALSEGYRNARTAALLAERDALIVGTQEGSAERLRIEQETAARILELDRQTTEGRKALLTEQMDAIAGIVGNSLSSLNTIQEAGKSQALNRDEAQLKQQLQAAGDNAEQREKIEKQHALNKERIEREYAEKRRKIALAQAVISAATAVMQILSAPAAPFVEPFATIVRGVQIGLVAATTAAQIGAINSQKFAKGTVLQGPSHAQGGIQLYSPSGYHFGEAEGGEPILTAAVSRNKALLSAASAINVAAGGRPLVPSSFNALGGITTSALVRDSVRGGLPGLNANELGEAVAESLRRNPPVNRWQDFKESQARNTFTESLANR